eukprot:527942_1
MTVLFSDAEIRTIAGGNIKYCELVGDGNVIIQFSMAMADSWATLGCFWLFYRKMKLLQHSFKPTKSNSEFEISQSPSPSLSSPSPSSPSSTGNTNVVIRGFDVKNNDENDVPVTPKRNQPTKKDHDLLYIIRKYAILSGASIISSYIGYFLVIASSLSFSAVAVDTVLNCWCIVLFDKRYDRIYQKLFGKIAYSKVRDESMTSDVGSSRGTKNE